MAINSSLLWNPCTILPKRRIVAHQVKSHRLFFHPSRCVLCLNSRCSSIAFRELILYSSIFAKINPVEFSLSSVIIVGWSSRKKRCQDQDDAMNQHLRGEQLDREDYVSCVPLSPYPMLESRDEILVLVGVSCHIPSFSYCTRLASGVHHVWILQKIEMGIA